MISLTKLRGLFPLTTAGVLLLLGTVAATWYIGAGKSDLVLLVFGFALAAFLGCITILVILGAVILKRRLDRLAGTDIAPLLLEEGLDGPTEFSLAVPGWLPFLGFSWKWVGPCAAALELRRRDGKLHEYARAARRGEFSQVCRRFTVTDALHLSEISFVITDERLVQVFPRAGRGHQLSQLNNLVAGDEVPHPQGEPDGDRVDIRQYTRGDSPRTILWKVFARSRKLMVKVPERAMAAQPRACCFLVTGERDRGAAGLGRDIVESDLLGEGWRFGVDGLKGYAANRRDSLLALMRSGDPSLWEEPSDLPTFLAEATRAGYGSCFVLVGADPPSERLERVRQSLSSSRLKTVLCLVVNDFSRKRSSVWSRYLMHSSVGTSTVPEELEALWKFWKDGDIEVRLVERESGAVYRDVPHFFGILRDRARG